MLLQQAVRAGCALCELPGAWHCQANVWQLELSSLRCLCRASWPHASYAEEEGTGESSLLSSQQGQHLQTGLYSAPTDGHLRGQPGKMWVAITLALGLIGPAAAFSGNVTLTAQGSL